MASIVYQTDKKTGTKYAFESISYWDKDKKQPRSKRKYLGKVDPVTGEIIPSRGRSTHSEDIKTSEGNDLQTLYAEIPKRDKIIEDLRREREELAAKNQELLTLLQKIRVMTEIV